MEKRMDTLIQLQQQKMELEKERLQLKCEIAGLSKRKIGQFFLISRLVCNEIAQ